MTGALGIKGLRGKKSPSFGFGKPQVVRSTDDVATISIAEEATVVPKPYAKSRPSYGKGQVDEVWENARQADGNVYDPNTGEQLFWDRSQSRNGQWDMGHVSGKEYRKLHQQYMNGEITLEEFKASYRSASNYQPESPSANRSHKYEQK